MKDLKLFYCTTGHYGGKRSVVIPIRAKSLDKAREYMFARFGREWGFSYTEKQWLDAKAEADENDWTVESETEEVIYNPYVKENE